MAGNSFGKLFNITTFGESHGKAIGVVIDGCPAGIAIDFDFLQIEMNRRKPGQSSISTPRNEADELEIISGVFEGKTTGSPITILIHNKDTKSSDYDNLQNTFRPSHADFTYEKKYGIRDHRGGGRSSARETAARVAAGAIAKLILQKKNIQINAFVKQIGNIVLAKKYDEIDFSAIEKNIVRCPDETVAAQMISLIATTKENGDSIGGVVQCVVQNCPIGLGEPVFDKLQADLAKAMLSINAVKGFEYGEGFQSATMLGSEHNDSLTKDGFASNHSGGILGGISNGDSIYFNVAFKPVATIAKPQQTIDKDNNEIILEAKGRHDACVVPRAVPIVEAMAAIVLVDHLLRSAAYINQ